MKIFSRIYYEKEALQYDRVQHLLKKYKNIEQIECHHYGEIFNLKNQNFRTQKENIPSLIIAVKKGKKVLPTPEGFGIGGSQNYYFSHMQNCLYDCRYCFLQGMYNSANYVWFANYEDFFAELTEANSTDEKQKYFFSGYDCDSLVFESVTNFVAEFFPFFQKNKNAIFELRTKSVNIKALLDRKPIENLIIAFSFTPEEISKKTEHKTPPIRSRIKALQNLAKQGWKVGIRLDPLIYKEDYQVFYQNLLTDIFTDLERKNIHSISIGPLRFPKKMHEKIQKLYPEENLLTEDLEQRGNMISYGEDKEKEMQIFIRNELKRHVEDKLIFSCNNL